jgi:drug/metabolite transporter (DMT)-like permease
MHSSLFSKFLGMMAALCWAVGTILIKRLRSTTPVDLLDLTAWQMILGAVPLGRAEPGGHGAPNRLDPFPTWAFLLSCR